MNWPIFFIVYGSMLLGEGVERAWPAPDSLPWYVNVGVGAIMIGGAIIWRNK